MALVFKIEDYDTPTLVGRRLIEASEKPRQMKSVMNNIFLEMLIGNEANIRSGGVRGGGSYAQLKPRTIEKKGTAEILYTRGANPKYSSIGNDALVNSVTQNKRRFQIKEVTNTTVKLGTTRPYAGTHQYGNPARRIPRRPFLQFTQYDVDRWNKMIAAKLMEGLKTR